MENVHRVDVSDAVVAGHLCLDIIPAFPPSAVLPQPGELVEIGPAVFSTGGPVSNAGLALHHLGVDTRLMGKVGADPFGQVILDLVRARDPKLADGILVVPGETTSYTVVLSFPHRDRSFLHCTGANDTFRAGDVNFETVAAARLFHFGYPPLMAQMYADDGRELVEIFRTVKGFGVTTSLDMVMVDRRSPAGRADWHGILRGVMPYVDLFLPSVEEMLLMLEPDRFDRLASGGALLEQVTPGLVHELADTLLSWGAKIVGLKLGHRGLYLRTAPLARMSQLGRAAPADLGWTDRELWAPVFQVEHFVGTTGSGDSTIAGFIAALLAGCSAERALAFACAVGACNVEAADALSGLQTWDDTWARLNAGWSRVPLDIRDATWHFNPEHQLWAGPTDPLARRG